MLTERSLELGNAVATGWRLPAMPWRLDSPPPGTPYSQEYQRIRRWATQYLCQPHPELGRAGPVCPYVPAALRRGHLFATVWPGRPCGIDEVVAGMRTYRHWFEQLVPSGDHALMVMFPAVGALDVHRVVEEPQRRLKTEFVARGLMIGEFHTGPPPAAGLHNPRFQPLHSPVPLLAIRRMVPGDLPFLLGDPRHRAAYSARFPASVTA